MPLLDDDEQQYQHFDDILLKCDEHDYHAIVSAMRHRVTFTGGIPDGDGNHAGRLVAEICRGWMEMLKLNWSIPRQSPHQKG